LSKTALEISFTGADGCFAVRFKKKYNTHLRKNGRRKRHDQ